MENSRINLPVAGIIPPHLDQANLLGLYTQHIEGVFMSFSTVSEWLNWMGSIHAKDIDLGLDRVKIVAEKLQLLHPTCKVITVAGTNGKGSTVAGLEAIYLAAGYHVGTFTSPMLFKINEQVRVDGNEATDADFCEAFAKVEIARGNITLTPFEFQTLAALVIFQKYPLDVMILEIGLGGRLDAVNVLDADLAIITSIAIDHVEWLGATREEIGYEKAGIFRLGKPAVCGDFNPPRSIFDAASKLNTPLYCQEKEFRYIESPVDWSWYYKDMQYEHLPLGTLSSQNMATVLMAINLLPLKIKRKAIDHALTTVTLPGRIQIMRDPIMKIFDVSHNPAAVAHLAERLKQIPCYGKTFAVFSMLNDKDIALSIKTINPLIDEWYVASLQDKRATSISTLKTVFAEADIRNVTFFATIQDAYETATAKAQTSDRIVTFGSFRTVAEVLSY